MAVDNENSLVAQKGRRRREEALERKAKGAPPARLPKPRDPKDYLIDPTGSIQRPFKRPFPSLPKWTDPVEFQTCIDAYFDYCDTNFVEKQMGHSKGITIMRIPIPYSMAGLSRALGISTESLNKYKHQDTGLTDIAPDVSQQIADIILAAKDRIHENNITMGLLGCHDSKISELNLINNFGYTRRTEIELPAGGEVNVVFSTDRTQKRIEDLEKKNLELMSRLNQIEHKPESEKAEPIDTVDINALNDD